MNKTKITIMFIAALMVIAIGSPGFCKCQSKCLDQYVEVLKENEEYVIENVVLLSEKPETSNECIARFMVSSPNENKVITAILEFGADCKLLNSTGISTVYLKRNENGKLSIKTRYLPLSKIKLPEPGG